MTIGEKIKAARKKKGLKQEELAERLNISYQNIGQWENGVRTPKLQTLQKIASALDISMLELQGFSLSDVPTEDLLAELERRVK